MIFSNTVIISKFIRAKLASVHGGTESTIQALNNAAIRGTAILITVTMNFILTAPVNIVVQVTSNINADIHPLLCPFLYFFVGLNHSINGLLYCIVGFQFKKELMIVLCCNRKEIQRSDTRISKFSSRETV